MWVNIHLTRCHPGTLLVWQEISGVWKPTFIDKLTFTWERERTTKARTARYQRSTWHARGYLGQRDTDTKHTPRCPFGYVATSPPLLKFGNQVPNFCSQFPTTENFSAGKCKWKSVTKRFSLVSGFKWPGIAEYNGKYSRTFLSSRYTN